MAPFSDLPNELLQRVLDLLDPRDLENFTFAGKSLYLLAVKHLQRHRALKKRYNKVATSDANPISGFSTGDTMHHWQLLKELKLHPWKRSYVTMLHIDYRYGYWDAEYDLFDTYILPYDDTTTAEKEKVISDSAFEDSENIDFQKLEVSKGEEDQVIILLLLELSSLKILTLEVNCSHGSCFYEMLRWHADMPGPPSLSHLESVTIRTLDHSDEWSLLSTFAAIPPVKSLVGKYIGPAGDDAINEFNLEPRCSNVHELSLYKSHANSDTLSKLLHGIKSLKSFSYDLAGWAVDADTFLTTHNALLAHTKTSLEVFSLRDSDYTQQHMLSFRDFNALKELTIDFALDGFKAFHYTQATEHSPSIHRDRHPV